MVFEYSAKRTFTDSIDVVDIGNTALKCTNVKFDDYYFIIKTVMGKTHILKYGPVCSDLEMLLNDFAVTYKKIDYKEPSICKEIDKFINDVKKEINSIEEITEYEAWQAFPAVRQYFENA